MSNSSRESRRSTSDDLARHQGTPNDGERELRQLLDRIPQHILVLDADGHFLHVNQAGIEYSGVSEGEFPHTARELVARFVHPDDGESVLSEYGRALSLGVEAETEARFRRGDGQYRCFLVRINPIRDDHGRIVRSYVTVTDIEERKQAEERSRLIIDTTPAMIHSALPDGSLDYLNQRWLTFLGLPLEEVQGWRWTRAIHPEDRDAFVAEWREALATGEPFEAESRVQRADGEYRWVLHRKVPLRDGAGNVVKWYGSSTDIEDRKRAEDRGKQQERELRETLDLVPQHVRVLGADYERLYANRKTLDFAGLTLEEWRRLSEPLLLVHPDDKERLTSAVQKKLSNGAPFEVELRTLRADGQYRWFLVRYNPLHDDQGHVTRWYVAGRDIDERKQEEERIQKENVALREEVDKTSMFEEIVGNSAALRAVLDRVAKVAPTESTALITGETGTGKELIARAIHKRSPRADRAFVSVNCAAIPHALITSELFGHEKGAFTGALQRRLGRFELAEGGTLFLDEVGELPPEIQVALLRVLQEREFERIGGAKPIRADVRLVAATNRDVRAAIDAGTFRSDLFYRLNVFPIDVPPLCRRGEDIPVLVEYFVDRYASKAGKRFSRIDPKTMDLLQAYPWPGNIRELQNVIERSVIVCDSDSFSVDESWLASESHSSRPTNGRADKLAAQAQERATIEAALAETKGRVSGPRGAAAKLGLRPTTLDAKIQSLGINKHRFKIV
jgi:formate hydrogenlyase transcriptional activator